MNGCLIYNASLDTSLFHDVHNLYIVASEQLGINLFLIKNSDVYCVYKKEKVFVDFKGLDCEIDFVIFLDKDIRLASQLEMAGYNVFNSAKAIEVCDDKIYTYQEMIKYCMPIPKTIVSKLYFNDKYFIDDEFNKYIASELGFPLIVKEAFGSFGQQVYLINDIEQLEKIQMKLLFKPHLYQENIKSSTGKDVRIYVVGDEVVGSMLRYSENDFRANVVNGGKVKAYIPSDEFKKLAIDATRTVGADFAGVDILFGEDDRPILCEINSNAHIKGIYDCLGINVAEHILTYIKEKVSK